MKTKNDKPDNSKLQIDDATIKEAQELLSKRIEAIRSRAIEEDDSGIESVYQCLNCNWEGLSAGNDKNEIVCPKCKSKAFLAGINVLVPDAITIQDPITNEQLDEIRETVQNVENKPSSEQGTQATKEDCPKCTGNMVPIDDRSNPIGNDQSTPDLIFKCDTCGYMKIKIEIEK